MSELAKQMKAYGITDPWDLTEFDQWVNDATRKDIETVAEQHNYNVFGLELWGKWTKIRVQDLKGALNFSVGLIFKNEDEAKVDEIIQKYEKDSAGQWNRKATIETVNKLHSIAILVCTWV